MASPRAWFSRLTAPDGTSDEDLCSRARLQRLTAGLAAVRADVPAASRSTEHRFHASRAARSVHAELMEALVVDARVMCQFVDDGDPHLLGEILGIGEVGLQWQLEQ
jgi:hypothetical protein